MRVGGLLDPKVQHMSTECTVSTKALDGRIPMKTNKIPDIISEYHLHWQN